MLLVIVVEDEKPKNFSKKKNTFKEHVKFMISTVKSQKYRDLYYNSNLNIPRGKMQKTYLVKSQI